MEDYHLARNGSSSTHSFFLILLSETQSVGKVQDFLINRSLVKTRKGYIIPAMNWFDLSSSQRAATATTASDFPNESNKGTALDIDRRTGGSLLPSIKEFYP